ncbi:MAG TPA: glycerol-3-phosphate dehydrogenase [Xanthobacteraceae bacterium]|nr:glycerol-3-phosphate dehydrogenase [Xanthobacteraceae bacterium]
MADFDLAVIGGGINGTGIARDAAGRGFRVVLIEQNDLASGTSSASSKLIHGGLRYLEHYEFRLVREALREREVLLRLAPHLIRPLRFVLPINEARRSAMLLRIGLFIYDWIGWRKILPGTREVDLVTDEAGQPLKSRFHHAYEYSDCFADDARLVVLNAVDAAERGAVIRTRTRCVWAERNDTWRLVLNARGQRDVVTARILVNAAGAWSELFAETALRTKPQHRLRLDKGTHIVVPKLYDHDRAYILQAVDGRVVFAIPFQRDFTLIGTTDRAFAGDPSTIIPTGEEIEYLCGIINEYFRAEIGAADVVWAYAGVRSLYDDGAGRPEDIGRDYTLMLDERYGEAPVLTVYGGKITTYRRLAEDAMARLAHFFPHSRAWTAQSPLPGGDFLYDGIATVIERAQQTWKFLTADHARRLVSAYGTRVDRVLGTAKTLDDLGMRLGADLTAAEVRYLMTKEWARSADDVLWRRSKLGLRFSDAQRAALDRFMTQTDTTARA